MIWVAVLIIVLALGILALCAWVIVKPRFGNGLPTAMGQFVGEQLLLVNKNQQRAVENMIYQREDKEREDNEGDDVGRFEGEDSEN